MKTIKGNTKRTSIEEIHGKPGKYYLLLEPNDKINATCVAQNYQDAYHKFAELHLLDYNVTNSFAICYWRTWNLCHKQF